MKQKVEKITIFLALIAIIFSGGCGVVDVMSTPNQYEKKIPAEYDLAAQNEKKVLVLVEQPSWLSTQENLRYYLTEAIRESLIAKVKIASKQIISYKELTDFRSSTSDFSMLSPVAVGETLGADIVLLVIIEDYQLNEVSNSDYYDGILVTQAILYDTKTGNKLWPEPEMSKSVRINFDAEKDREAAVIRLVNACAYCTTRYFYDCPKYKFKIFEEGKKAEWEE